MGCKPSKDLLGPVKDGVWYEIVPRLNPNLRVDVACAQSADGTKINTWHRNFCSAQRFKAKKEADDTWSFEPACALGSRLDNGGAEKAHCHVWTACDTKNQRWTLEAASDGYFRIKSAATGLYLDVYQQNKEAGANIYTWDKNDAENQQFRFDEVIPALENDAVYEIVPKHAPAMRLDVNGAGQSNGVKIQIWSSNGGPAQRFKVTQLPSGAWSFAPLCAPGHRVDNSGAEKQHCHIWEVVDTPNQAWDLHPLSDGFFMVRCHATGHVLDVYCQGKDDGTAVYTWDANEGDHQQFKFEKK